MPLAHADLLYSARRRCAAVQTSGIASPQQSLMGAAVNGWVGWIAAIPSDPRVRRAAGCVFLRCTADLKPSAFGAPLCGCGA